MPKKTQIKYLDLFCGIGGFRFALEEAAAAANLKTQCVLSSDIDQDCQKAYYANFREMPLGDIHQVTNSEIKTHDLLLAGFPCQPFSICGDMKGFADARGTLFFEIARIIKAKMPAAFVLENVKLLKGHDGGRTLRRILQALRELGYFVDCQVLNALDFGLPQKRERIFIVGLRDESYFEWPQGGVPMKPLDEVLEDEVDARYFASERIRKSRLKRVHSFPSPSIWHENKAGHVSAYPFSCALRAGASHNYLLVNGERRLTPREMLRLQGFPETFKIIGTDSRIRKQAGNSVPVPVVRAVIESVFQAVGWTMPDEAIMPLISHEERRYQSPR